MMNQEIQLVWYFYEQNRKINGFDKLRSIRIFFDLVLVYTIEPENCVE